MCDFRVELSMYVAVCCNVMQRGSDIQYVAASSIILYLPCSALQCVAVCCSVLQRVAALSEIFAVDLQCLLQCVALHCSELQCIAECYSRQFFALDPSVNFNNEANIQFH